MLDPSVSQMWDERPYWHQYEWEFPQHVFRWYLEETLYVGPLTASVGARQFLVGLSRTDDFNVDPELAVDSNSDLLFSGGVTYESPIEGLRLFAGYSENFRAFSSALLEVPGRSLDALEPETSSNIDLGVQYSGGRVALSGTWYSVDFENRIVFLGPQTVAGPNYLIPGGGSILQCRRFRHARVRVLGHCAATTPSIPIFVLHAQQLRVYWQRKFCCGCGPRNAAGYGRYGRA